MNLACISDSTALAKFFDSTNLHGSRLCYTNCRLSQEFIVYYEDFSTRINYLHKQQTLARLLHRTTSGLHRTISRLDWHNAQTLRTTDLSHNFETSRLLRISQHSTCTTTRSYRTKISLLHELQTVLHNFLNLHTCLIPSRRPRTARF